jgi:hypothetical protein
MATRSAMPARRRPGALSYVAPAWQWKDERSSPMGAATCTTMACCRSEGTRPARSGSGWHCRREAARGLERRDCARQRLAVPRQGVMGCRTGLPTGCCRVARTGLVVRADHTVSATIGFLAQLIGLSYRASQGAQDAGGSPGSLMNVTFSGTAVQCGCRVAAPAMVNKSSTMVKSDLEVSMR